MKKAELLKTVKEIEKQLEDLNWKLSELEVCEDYPIGSKVKLEYSNGVTLYGTVTDLEISRDIRTRELYIHPTVIDEKGKELPTWQREPYLFITILE